MVQSSRITVVNYGLGNLGSIANMLKKIGAQVEIVSNKNEVEKAKKLILPGVGAFDAGMSKIRSANLYSTLDNLVRVEKIPVLGICLGMQLLAEGSEEGEQDGFGWIPCRIRRFDFGNLNESDKLKIPHMGWNTINIKENKPIFHKLDREDTQFYFVHSFHAPFDPAHNFSYATTFYGYEFASVIGRNNVIGTQFHPEKSHKFGMQLLRNFVENY